MGPVFLSISTEVFKIFAFILYANISYVGSCISRVLPKKEGLGKHF